MRWRRLIDESAYAADDVAGSSTVLDDGTEGLPDLLQIRGVAAKPAQSGMGVVDFAGTYTKIVVLKVIEYSFGDRTAQVEFTPGPKGVVIRVTFDSEPTHSIEQQQGGWQAILNNFARHVEANQQKS
jgi:hypothetical protein